MPHYRSFVAFALSAAFAVAAPQEPAKDAPKDAPKAEMLRRDPEAVKLLEAHDALMYYVREEGAKDVAFSLALPVGVLVDMKWMAPDKQTWSGRASPDVGEDIAKRLNLLLSTPSFKEAMDAQVPSFVRTVIGGKESDLYAKDSLELLGPKQLKIVAKNPETASKIKEITATFDEKGRLKLLQIASPLGAVSELEPTYLEHKGKFLVKEFKTVTKSAAGQAQVSTLQNEYVDVGGFMLLSRVTMQSPAAVGAPPAAAEKQELNFSGHKVNSGLTEADFKK